jgi:hypothetical protein
VFAVSVYDISPLSCLTNLQELDLHQVRHQQQQQLWNVCLRLYKVVVLFSLVCLLLSCILAYCCFWQRSTFPCPILLSKTLVLCCLLPCSCKRTSCP